MSAFTEAVTEEMRSRDPVSSEQVRTGQNRKNVQEVSKQKAFSRAAARHSPLFRRLLNIERSVMKPKSPRVSEPVRENADFSYVAALPKEERRAVAFYEYWRESPTHIELVNHLRKVGAFQKDFNAQLDAATLDKMARRSQIFPINILQFLAECVDFPPKPYRANQSKTLPRAVQGGGLGPLP